MMVLALAKYKGGDKMDEIKRVLVYYLERLEREEVNKKISWVFDCKVRLVARNRKLKGHSQHSHFTFSTSDTPPPSTPYG